MYATASAANVATRPPFPPSLRAHRSAWASDAATVRLLTEGGDQRIELDSDGLNQYGCGPRPDPLLVSFGSSTASVISAAGFEAAAQLHTRLRSEPQTSGLEMQRLRAEVLRRSGCAGWPQAHIVLAASGTDLHRIAAAMAQNDFQTSLGVVMCDPSETGGGVQTALSSRANRIEAVALRLPNGHCRPLAQIDADFADKVQQVLAQEARALLVLTDVSKTGLLAPSLACVQQLQQDFGERLTVLVDACQYRLAPSTVAAYLAQGFMLALTGSKFMTGPAFCGALILPQWLAERQPAQPDLPKAHWGLMLRWEAALAEIRRFRQIPEAAVRHHLNQWGLAVSQRLGTDPHYAALEVPKLDRSSLLPGTSWDSLQTIFPLLLFAGGKSARRRPLTVLETQWVHRQMGLIDQNYTWVSATQNAFNTRFQLGQPVPLGQHQGQASSALRIAMSARWVSDAVLMGQGPEASVAQAMLALDKLAWLCDKL